MIALAAVSALRDVKPPFLEGLSPADLKTVLADATPRHFLTNSIITHQGHPASHLFLLIQGSARYFYMTKDGQKILIRWLPAGEIIGGVALLPRPSHYLVSAETVKNSSALVWDRSAIRSLTERYPRLLENMLTIVSDYLDSYLALHVAMTRHTAGQRLAHVLINLASGIGHRVVGGIELAVSNEDLASAANVTPFTASRLLSQWQRRGMLTKSRGKVLLRNPERLVLHEI